MKKIVVLLCICLLMLCGCSETKAEAETETKVEVEVKVDVETEAENVCTVTFDSQGGSAVETQEVVWGGKATEPAPPTKECLCEFAGWYLGEEKWSFIGYSVTEDMTLTARWVECYGLNDKEFEIIKGAILYKGKHTWEDVANVQRNKDNYVNIYYSNYVIDEHTWEYQITFKNGATEFFYTHKKYVED